MRNVLVVLGSILAVAAFLVVGTAGGRAEFPSLFGETSKAHTRVSVEAEHAAVVPGGQTRLALRLVSEAGWHTYGKDPGEVGVPTSIEWTLCKNAKTGEWLWPPDKELVSYGSRMRVLEGDSVILIPVEVSAAAVGDEVTLAGTVNWLECSSNKCIPRNQAFSLKIPVQAVSVPVQSGVELFRRAEREARKAVPQTADKNAQTGAKVEASEAEKGVVPASIPAPPASTTVVTPPAPASAPMSTSPAAASAELRWEAWTPQRQAELLAQGRIVYVDFTAAWCVTCLANKWVYSDAAVAEALRKANVALLRADWTRRNPDIAAELASYKRAAIPLNVFLRRGQSPLLLSELLTTGEVLRGLNAALAQTSRANGSHIAAQSGATPASLGAFLACAGFGFLGGMLLNLMPCVFPVLGLKLVHLAAQGGGDRRGVARHGLVFTVGVLVSFWILAGALLALRGGGATLGWGFQLQEPRFVFGVAVVFLLLALNLAGVFEIGMGAASAGEKLRGTPGLRGAFFAGVLATVTATPCAAPLLGASLGVALALPPAQALVVFTCIALGLASPYLLTATAPGLPARILPKPGLWMETFKQAMAFPMFASAAYLLWVLAAQLENHAALLRVLLALVGVAMSTWIYGRWTLPHRSRRTRRAALLAALSLLATSCAYGLMAVL